MILYSILAWMEFSVCDGQIDRNRLALAGRMDLNETAVAN